MAFAVHHLGVDDVPLMDAMRAMFGAAFEDEATYLGKPPSADEARAWLAREGVIALAAVEDGAVIGGLVAYVLPKFEQARSEIYIYDLAVAEAHRRRGVATALIRRLQAIAAERGIAVTTLVIAWVRRHASGPLPILGSRRITVAREALAAMTLQLDNATWRRIGAAAGIAGDDACSS